MAREAGELTVAIRNLLEDSKGAITHGEARPKLRELGFNLAADIKPLSDNAKLWIKESRKHKRPDNDADQQPYFDKIAQKLTFDDRTVCSVIREIDAHIEFKNERNSFDVTKYNWKKAHGGVVSRRPVDSRNSKARVAAKVSKQRGQRKTAVPIASEFTTEERLKALSTVETMGGLAGLHKMIKAKEVEIEANEAEIEKRLKANDAVEGEIADLKTVEAAFMALQQQVKQVA